MHLVSFSLPGGPEAIGSTLAATGRTAEEAGPDTVKLQLLMTGVTCRHPGLLADVERRRRALRRHALPARRDDQLASASSAAAPAHHGRRRREKKTLRLVAKYADAGNVFAAAGAGTDDVAHKLAVLRDWCEREGRPYDDIRRTVLCNGPVGQDPAGAASFVEEMRALADVGVDEVHVMPLHGDPVAFVRSLGDHVVGPLSRL